MIDSLVIPHDNLHPIRQRKFADFCVSGLPNKKNEAWKYTDISFLAKEGWRLSAKKKLNFELANINGLPKNRILLVFINGRFDENLSGIDHLPAGLTIMPLATAIAAEKLNSIIESAEDDSLVNLNSALMNSGVYIALAANVKLKIPVQLLYISAIEQHITCQTRQVIQLERAAEMTIIESHHGYNQAHIWQNIVTQMKLKEEAKLNYYKLQNENDLSVHLATTRIQQATGSELQGFIFAEGAKLARDHLQIFLQGQRAATKLYGSYLANKQQHIAQNTKISHAASQTCSEEIYKGIVGDQATGVFNGQIIVDEHIAKVAAHLTNKNLLLSKHATVNTKPELQIYADDVKCSHGATVGQLDPQALFYLRSRGIDYAEAIQLLTQAFMADLFNIITNEELVFYFQHYFGLKLQQMKNIGKR